MAFTIDMEALRQELQDVSSLLTAGGHHAQHTFDALRINLGRASDGMKVDAGIFLARFLGFWAHSTLADGGGDSIMRESAADQISPH